MANTEGASSAHQPFNRPFHEALTFWGSIHGVCVGFWDGTQDLDHTLYNERQQEVHDVVAILHSMAHHHLAHGGVEEALRCDVVTLDARQLAHVVRHAARRYQR